MHTDKVRSLCGERAPWIREVYNIYASLIQTAAPLGERHFVTGLLNVKSPRATQSRRRSRGFQPSTAAAKTGKQRQRQDTGRQAEAEKQCHDQLASPRHLRASSSRVCRRSADTIGHYDCSDRSKTADAYILLVPSVILLLLDPCPSIQQKKEDSRGLSGLQPSLR